VTLGQYPFPFRLSLVYRLDPAASAVDVSVAHLALDRIVVWTEPPRPTICVEPCTAPPGAVPAGDRCLWLAPGQSRRLRCRFRISALAQAQPPPTSAATSRTIAHPGLTSDQTRAAPIRTGETANNVSPGAAA
jgi:galactose mutarotase-like enzyme